MFNPHPYEVLAVEPTATNAEILKAFAKAMQRKQYAPDVLAKARKVLMDPADRPLLDYLWGTWRKRSDVREADPTLLDALDAEIEMLDRAIQNLSVDDCLTRESMATEIAAADRLFGQSLQNFSY
jgi:curved DNA-binding protein CbpA